MRKCQCVCVCVCVFAVEWFQLLLWNHLSTHSPANTHTHTHTHTASVCTCSATVDDLLPITALDFICGTITVVGIVLLASSLNPFIFLVAAPLTVIFFKLRSYYLKASREIKRVEAIQRSPKYVERPFL